MTNFDWTDQPSSRFAKAAAKTGTIDGKRIEYNTATGRYMLMDATINDLLIDGMTLDHARRQQRNPAIQSLDTRTLNAKPLSMSLEDGAEAIKAARAVIAKRDPEVRQAAQAASDDAGASQKAREVIKVQDDADAEFAASKAAQRGESDDDGYCRHGEYVGGTGPDYMCGQCENGDDDELPGFGIVNRCPGFARCSDPKPNAYSHACALMTGHENQCRCSCSREPGHFNAGHRRADCDERCEPGYDPTINFDGERKATADIIESESLGRVTNPDGTPSDVTVAMLTGKPLPVAPADCPEHVGPTYGLPCERCGTSYNSHGAGKPGRASR